MFFEFLAIAQDLAALTYFIGALVMALPIPLYGLKKWGPRLIADGLYSSILVNLYEVFLSITLEIGNMLGANWSYYITWLYSVLAAELQVYVNIRSIYLGVSSIPYLNPLAGPVTLFLSIVSAFASVTGTLIVISQLIYNNVGLIIILGILFMSLPFRIGRSIGGSLIGFAIVFYIGLPLLPSFLNMFGVDVLNVLFSSNDSISLLITQAIPEYLEGAVLMPVVYLGILSSISLGLGSAISGTYSRLPIPLDFL
ncbi:DNA import protein CedA [Metallosphaera hakonensis]|uniref:DNA import protein CedA n=1 Tax=Metallosphaera hakonensis TaxID=79601 RepID=UPI0006D1E4A1|nr:DNA import protein CedA [Metallosphaera hakonensis]